MMVVSWVEVCVSSLVVVNHISWDNIELERLSESFVVWAVVVICWSNGACVAGGGLINWAMVVTVVGSWVVIIKL